jgi:hypothetical protein
VTSATPSADDTGKRSVQGAPFEYSHVSSSLAPEGLSSRNGPNGLRKPGITSKYAAGADGGIVRSVRRASTTHRLGEMTGFFLIAALCFGTGCSSNGATSDGGRGGIGWLRGRRL